MQQYRKSNFSDVFCLNCIFVVDDVVNRDMEAVYLQTASASTPIASASKKFTEILLVKYDQCVGSRRRKP